MADLGLPFWSGSSAVLLTLAFDTLSFQSKGTEEGQLLGDFSLPFLELGILSYFYGPEVRGGLGGPA